MALSRRGQLESGRRVRVRPPEFDISDTGLVTMTEEYKCNNSDVLSFFPRIGSRHETYQSLECRRVSPFFGPLQLGGWRAEYRGVVGSGSGGSGSSLPDPVWTMQSVAGEQDIRTFARFDEMKAAAEAADGFKVDDQGIFLAFTAPEAIAGIQTFFAPSIVLSKRFVTTSIPSGANRVGKISQPDGPYVAGAASGNQNWLLISFESQKFGDVYENSIIHLRSGDKGWLSAIYG
jgi:hypothetical protein